MKPLSSTSTSLRPDILRAKLGYGLLYGMALGFGFSIFVWGIDAYLLAKANGLLPWLKFLGGAIPCTLIGGIAGWLSARLEKPLFSLLLWAITAWIFARLMINVPVQMTPRLLSLVDPGTANLLHYAYYPETFTPKIGVAFVWLLVFMTIAGLLQMPLSEPAVFSTSVFGKIAPFLMILVLMLVVGTTVDNFHNEALRAPVGTVDSTIQYILDHRGQDIDATTSREMHLASFRTLENLITPERRLVISGYNAYLEEVQVLIRFERGWVECQVFHNQLVSCKQVGKTVGSQ
ncbi:MAG TPA: hypothetical protein VHP14_11060 [Anaerolineales bacterium]|nr:hypothetical protein [Anaerolineales bacterium]